MRLRLLLSICCLYLAGCGALLSKPEPEVMPPILVRGDITAGAAAVQQTADAVARKFNELPSRSLYSQRLSVIRARIADNDSLTFIAASRHPATLVSLPDGRIIVSRTFLELLTDDEAAAIIALELGQLQLGHSKSRVESAVARAAKEADGELDSKELRRAVQAFFAAQYSAGQIEQARGVAEELLRLAGSSPAVLSSALRKCAALERAPLWANAYRPLVNPDTALRAGEGDFEPMTPSDRNAVKSATLSAGAAAAKEELPAFAGDNTPAEEEEAGAAAATVEAGGAGEGGEFEEFEEQIAVEQEPDSASLKEMAAAGIEGGLSSADQTASPLDGVSADSELKSGWYVQMAAEEQMGLARQKRDSLRRAGRNAGIQSAVVGGRSYYRVLVGPFDTRAAAESARRELRSAAEARGRPFLKQIQ